MSAYLARLKQLEDGKNYHYAPDTVPPKPPEPPFAGFDGTGAGHIEKIIDDAVIGTPPEQTPVKPLSLKDRQREARRQKVLSMLEAAPETQRAIYADTDSDSHNVILAVAVRACQQTCEMLIDKATYDPWALLELIERQGAQNVH